MDLLSAYSSGSDDFHEEDPEFNESACKGAGTQNTEPGDAPGRDGMTVALIRPGEANLHGTKSKSLVLEAFDAGASNAGLPHQGRKRSFTLANGEYPLVVCIPVPLDTASEEKCQQVFTQLLQLVPDLQPMMESLQDTQRTRLRMHQQDQTLRHVSLSRTVPLRFHDTESLLMELKRELRSTTSVALVLTGLQCFVNDEKTRSFLAVPVSTGKQQDAEPHMSFGWVLGDQRVALEAAILHVNKSATLKLDVPLERIICRVGQREHCVWKQGAR